MSQLLFVGYSDCVLVLGDWHKTERTGLHAVCIHLIHGIGVCFVRYHSLRLSPFLIRPASGRLLPALTLRWGHSPYFSHIFLRFSLVAEQVPPCSLQVVRFARSRLFEHNGSSQFTSFCAFLCAICQPGNYIQEAPRLGPGVQPRLPV